MEPKEWTLLVISATRNQGLNPIQLQKALFLFERRLFEHAPAEKIAEPFYHFLPEFYGPFDANIYQDVEILQKQGLVFVETSRYKRYYATCQGDTIATQLRTHLSARVLTHLDTIVAWVLDQGFRELLLAVYQAYPDFREHSMFQG